MPEVVRRPLGSTGLLVTRLGVGLAAIARPGYITLGRAADLPADRTPDALYARTAEILDAARAAGIGYADVARSYGRAEGFLARWLRERAVPRDALVVGTKWGYAYTAGWRVDAAVHEQKELSTARFETQLAESRAILGDRIDLHQIHSATVESGCLADTRLLAALVAGRRRRDYRAVGLTLSGADSARALDLAMAARVDGERVFDVVQATFNVLEPSLASGLRAAHEAGMGVVAKEVFANGRLTDANARPEDARTTAAVRAAAPGVPLDRIALAFVLAHPFVDVALSGAATTAHLASHWRRAASPSTGTRSRGLRRRPPPTGPPVRGCRGRDSVQRERASSRRIATRRAGSSPRAVSSATTAARPGPSVRGSTSRNPSRA
jgi:aryl-alcohol dehydrogenase-like predicted oxidoreductase